jgi:hypothetical protein
MSWTIRPILCSLFFTVANPCTEDERGREGRFAYETCVEVFFQGSHGYLSRKFCSRLGASVEGGGQTVRLGCGPTGFRLDGSGSASFQSGCFIGVFGDAAAPGGA